MTATKNMTPKTIRVLGMLVIMGQAVKTTGIVLCNFIYDMNSCDPRATSPLKGSR